MTVGDAVVLGRSGGFGSGLNFRRFERVDGDHAGCRGMVGELVDGENPSEGKKKDYGLVDRKAKNKCVKRESNPPLNLGRVES